MLRKFSFWLLILCMCICALVAQKIEREIIPAYPRHFDQSGYLYQTYLLYGDSIKNGVFASLGRQLFEHTPNGILLVPQGALAMHFLGPTRFSCLAVNIAYYCAALILLSWSVRRRYGFAAALVAIGLFLAAYSPFYVGGMLDFRRDFLTECLFFCVYAFWLSSESLLRRRETLWLTFSVGVLIANRFITATYIAGIFFVLGIALALLGMHCRRKKDLAELPCIRQRIVNYLLACITIGVIGSSIIIYNYKAIFAYYGIGHVLGSEKYIRSAEMHIATRMDSLSFYPKSLLQDHLGGAFLLIGAVALGAVFVSRVLQKKVVGKSNSLDATLNTVFVVAGFVVPLAILTSDISKSPVVGGILVPAVVVGTALLFAWSSKRDSRWTTGIACVVLIGGCGAFLSNVARPSVVGPPLALSGEVNSVYEAILGQVVAKNIEAPRIAFMDTNEYLLAGALNTWCFERHKRYLNAVSTVGGGIFALTKDEIEKGLEEADIILLPEKARTGVYPIYASMERQWSFITLYTKKHFTLATTIAVEGRDIHLYVRNVLPVSGLSGGWITEGGVSSHIAASLGAREIVFEYRVPSFARYQIEPQPKVTLADVNGVILRPQVSIEKLGDESAIHIAIARENIGTEMNLKVVFDRFFVPRALGLNTDERHLVAEFSSLSFVCLQEK